MAAQRVKNGHTLGAPLEDDRELVINVPTALLESLRSKCAAKAEVTLLGRLQGKHPGLKALTAWARETLHSSLLLLSLKTNNLFEVTFTSPEGRIHALTQTDLTCQSATITFSSWRPQFDPKTPQSQNALDFPIWVQVVDLCQVLRDEHLLHTIGAQIGKVVAVDNSEAYRAKLFGPRIRILVQDLNTLPLTIALPKIEGEGKVRYLLEYSGLPNQCGRCRSRDHPVRSCPRKDVRQKKSELDPKPQPTAKTATKVPPSTASQAINLNNTTQPPVQVQKTTPELDPDPPQEVGEVPDPVGSRSPDMEGADTNKKGGGKGPAAMQQDNGPAALQQDNTETVQPAHTPMDVAPTEEEIVTIEKEQEKNVPAVLQQVNGPAASQQDSIGTPQASAHTPKAVAPTEEEIDTQGNELGNVPAALQQDDINFPPLSPPQGTKAATTTHQLPQEGPSTPSFVWRVRNDNILHSSDKGKGKQKQSAPRGSESAPLTRQGYRTGRLAEDFWIALDMPNTPKSTHKKLKVIPLLLRNPEQTEYLIDKAQAPQQTIATIQIAEILAGVPWAPHKVKQHIVNQISHALHKVLIFNTSATNPFQNWNQGQWHAHWQQGEEDEHTCTMVACIPVPVSKIKIRKGTNLVWRQTGPAIQALLTRAPIEGINTMSNNQQLWQEISGTLPETPNTQRAVLSEEEASSS